MGRPHARTHRGRRAMTDRAPKLIENPKVMLGLKGSHPSAIVSSFLDDISGLHKPHIHKYTHKNDVRPFEDVDPLLKFCKKHDTALFCHVNSSKKRPHNITLGRIFNDDILDMYEFGLDPSYVSLAKSQKQLPLNLKPVIIFQGSGFEMDPDLKKLKSFFVDFFRHHNMEKVHVPSLETVIVLSANCPDVNKEIGLDRKVRMQVASFGLLKSNRGEPYADLEEEDIAMDAVLTLRRIHYANPHILKTALRQPRIAQAPTLQSESKRVGKNIVRDVMGTEYGSVYVGHQDTDELALRKFKALKPETTRAADENEGDVDDQPDTVREVSE